MSAREVGEGPTEQVSLALAWKEGDSGWQMTGGGAHLQREGVGLGDT